MSRFLTVDVGAGTMDVLFFDTETGIHYKAVVRSPVETVAEKVRSAPQNIVATGKEMGGGAISQALIQKSRQAHVAMTPTAAATVHHTAEKVKSFGIEIVEKDKAEKLAQRNDYTNIFTGDIDTQFLEGLVHLFGVSFSFDAVGICVQDHGVSPDGISHLDYRQTRFMEVLETNPVPEALLYRSDQVPEDMNRLRSNSETAQKLPTQEAYVIDSGMAAILGASLDVHAREKKRIIVLDIATSHTVGAALEQGSLCGFFEYHTRDLTRKRLEQLLCDLGNGRLDHRQILSEGGHGAYLRKSFGFENAEAIIATGPKRKLIQGTGLPVIFGAPLGDNMMTGTVGIMEAIRRRKGLPPIQYV